jgi:hypothetical protein
MRGKFALDLRHMDERPVPARFLVHRCMAPTDRGAASNIGRPIPTVGGPSYYYTK